MPEKLIRAFDVAVALGFSTQTIKDMAVRGDLPGGVRIGRHFRFRPEAVREFIEAGGALKKTEPPEPPLPAAATRAGRRPCAHSWGDLAAA